MKEGPKEDARHAEYAVLHRLGDEGVHGAGDARRDAGVQLESAGLPSALVSLDAETGDVLQTQQTMWFAEGGAVSVTTTYSNYREVAVMRVPHRYTESTEMSGRTIEHGERVEVGVTLAPDTFALPPSTASGRGR